jgi:hypothetical protein
MIGAGLGFPATPLALGPNGQAQTPNISVTGTTAADAAASIRSAGQQNAGQAAPVSPLSPNAVTAIGEAANTDQSQTEEDATSPDNPQGLTEEELALVEDLKQTDQEVRRHEQAHMNAGGRYAGQASYTYENGPDGKRYAVAGEVPIDASPVPDDPQATIDKMQVVIRAALAPAEPSGQDIKVAGQARQSITEAQSDLRQQQREEAEAARSSENETGEPVNDAETQATDSEDSSAADEQGVSGLVSSVYNAVGQLGADDARNDGLSI